MTVSAHLVVPSSFRDPSGFVFNRDGVLLRQVNESYRPDFEELLASGLYGQLVDDGLLIPHEDAPVDLAVNGRAWRVIRPERIPFITYPYEWCFGQLKDAASITLDLLRRALHHGMVLKDASPFNVQFRGSRPVFIDTLSFTHYREGEPWIAYRAFCRGFLAPLALMVRRHVECGQLLQVYPNGVPLELAGALLGWRTWLDPRLAVHLKLHARFEGRSERNSRNPSTGGMSKRALLGMIDSLAGAVESLKWRLPRTEWADYYADPAMTTAGDVGEKNCVVRRLMEGRPLGMTWDLGANTGLFSRVVEDSASFVASIDGDPAAVEKNYEQCRTGRPGKILPLWIDLTSPTPAIGWANRERDSLLDRGPADTVLALALIHHLAIGNNVPLESVAEFMASCTRKFLLVEFVAKADEKVQRLLRSREDIFVDYDEDGFRRAFGAHFRVVERVALAGGTRILFLMDRAT